MSGLSLEEIFTALQGQLKARLEGRQQTVHALPTGPPPYPPDTIVIEPAPDFIDYFTSMGGDGIAKVRGVLVVTTTGADYQSQFKRMYDYLSCGLGNVASVIDAVLFDRTLGGKVDDCVILRCDITLENVTARLPFEIRVRKVGAEA